jgi:hypothetical protein
MLLTAENYKIALSRSTYFSFDAGKTAKSGMLLDAWFAEVVYWVLKCFMLKITTLLPQKMVSEWIFETSFYISATPETGVSVAEFSRLMA